MTGGPAEDQLEAAARALGAALRESGWRVAVAESSTGGLIGHSITMIPGSSDYFPGGVISYSNQAKEVELDVPGALLAEHGAVSAEVAAAMAEGVSHRFGTELGIAVTGVAGPEGGSEGKPVGTHWIGVGPPVRSLIAPALPSVSVSSARFSAAARAGSRAARFVRSRSSADRS